MCDAFVLALPVLLWRAGAFFGLLLLAFAGAFDLAELVLDEAVMLFAPQRFCWTDQQKHAGRFAHHFLHCSELSRLHRLLQN